MDVVGAVGVGEFLRGSVVDLGEDEGRERGDLGCGGGGGAFGKDGVVIGDACAVEEWEISYLVYRQIAWAGLSRVGLIEA